MGSICAKLYSRREVKILITGSDSAGKTSLLYRMKLGELIQTIPTVGFNVETVEVDNVKVTAWERPLVKHYTYNMRGLVYVVDSRWKDRVEENMWVLHELLTDVIPACPVLVVANRQDLPEHMSTEEIYEKMQLYTVKDRPLNICPASAATGEGVREGFTWLTKAIACWEASQDVEAVKDILIQDHSEKAIHGWDYLICAPARIKSWLSTSKT